MVLKDFMWDCDVIQLDIFVNKANDTYETVVGVSSSCISWVGH
jgi:hypothetical protein